MNWIDVIRHLLPNARAWRIVVDKTLKRFFEGLTGLAADAREFFDLVWSDLSPVTTRQLTEWEDQFGLPAYQLTESERRERLASAWQALGGQSPRYIQDTLQAAGFDVYVHEWWVPGSEPPIARNPSAYLNNDNAIVYLIEAGEAIAEAGEVLAEAGETVGAPGYPLVNKIFSSTSVIIAQCGEPLTMCGEVDAQCGNFTEYSFGFKTYPIPLNPIYWPYFLYIGGPTFPGMATVPAARRDEFETLCLKICPTQQWLGMLVTYT